MKYLNFLLSLFLVAITFSCSNDDDDVVINEVKDLKMVQEITNDSHAIELYNETGNFTLGYNKISLRVKDIATKQYVEDVSLSWKPVMHMTTKEHSCPLSAISKETNMTTVYSGYVVFQMPENDLEKWDMTINYKINGVDYEAKSIIAVPNSAKRRVTVVTGADNKRYIVALIEPNKPEVKTNDIVMGVYTMETMMSFPVVENFKINLDPRMPSMGNHSSPNNQDLVYDSASKLYKGKLSLTMTGYWKLNLMLRNQANEVLKGEAVTDQNEESTLFLELEF